MRIIKEIVFENCKASIFYMNQKYIVKFEQGVLEQTYKIGELDFLVNSVEDVENIISAGLLKNVQTIFTQMQRNFIEATKDF